MARGRKIDILACSLTVSLTPEAKRLRDHENYIKGYILHGLKPISSKISLGTNGENFLIKI